MTATVFPGVAFVVFFLLNLALWGDKATGAVPFGTLVALLLIWFTISVPLVFVGSFVGFRAAAWEHPVRINSIPRQIPDQIWYVYVCLELRTCTTMYKCHSPVYSTRTCTRWSTLLVRLLATRPSTRTLWSTLLVPRTCSRLSPVYSTTMYKWHYNM